MQYHQLRILCALRDKLAENDTSLTGHPGYGPGSRAYNTLGCRIA
jgi:hypothetical protein